MTPGSRVKSAQSRGIHLRGHSSSVQTHHRGPNNTTKHPHPHHTLDTKNLIDSQGTVGVHLEVRTHLERLIRALGRSK